MWGNASLWPYGYGYARRFITTQYSYFLQPSMPDYALPLDLATVKSYLRIDSANTVEDSFITSLITAAVQFGETYTKRDFITKKYLTYRDNFDDGFFVLRKSKFQSLISFQYLVNNVLTTVPAEDYYTTNQYDFSQILLVNGKSWPTDIDVRLQAIQIVFTAGYGTTAADVPQQLKEALMQHIAQMYENRGDCSGASGSDCESALPNQARVLYNQYRINDLTTQAY